MIKKAGELTKGTKISIGGEVIVVDSIEISDISKQGTKKCRIEAKNSKGDKIVIIRPVDYPINCV